MILLNTVVKINYLYHSGFSVETDQHLLIFDYYKDFAETNVKTKENGAIGESDLHTHKKIVVFSSHSHHDHFNPVILDWTNINPNIQYIFSKDIQVPNYENNIAFLSPLEEIAIDTMRIKAYGSTDLGVSYLVNVDNTTIFHAGDLNWWYWWDDTEEGLEKAEKWFKDEINKIKEEQIDIAFFPVDQRLKENYALGAKHFINNLNPKIFIPMHFGDKLSTTSKFKKEMTNTDTEIIELKRRGQEIIFTK
ncbi:MAG: MBL fold metallo-hydrolase [Eubacteriales bacterium]